METLRRLPVLNNTWPLLLNNLFNRDSFNEGNLDFFDQKNSIITPAVNIKELDQNFEIEMLAPGFSKNDFRIEVNGGELIITAEKSTENESQETGNYHKKEFSFESLKRKFTLPENIVDIDKISAEYNGGILYLEIPKKEEALPKPVKLIPIS
jgi:HSP20 family protein